MADPAEHQPDSDQNRVIAERVREALAQRRISRQRLADEAKISLSTLEKALAGERPFSLATLVRLEAALGVSLRPFDTMGGQASVKLGSYTHAAVAWLEGQYLTLRPSFEQADAVYAYRTEIYWDADAACLAFRESARQDAAFTQSGQVSLPHQSGHVYLVTNEQGQMRLITLGRPAITGEMYGLLSTLLAGRGGLLTPVAAPIALLPLASNRQPQYGVICPGDEGFNAAREALGRVLGEAFARLIGDQEGLKAAPPTAPRPRPAWMR